MCEFLRNIALIIPAWQLNRIRWSTAGEYLCGTSGAGAFGLAYQPHTASSQDLYLAFPFSARPGNGLMDTRLPRPICPSTERLRAGIFAGRADWARRKPMLLFLLSTSFLFRFDARKFSGLLFQEPPRITRWPSLGPFPL